MLGDGAMVPTEFKVGPGHTVTVHPKQDLATGQLILRNLFIFLYVEI